MWKRFGNWLQRNDANVAGLCVIGPPILLVLGAIVVSLIKGG